jgi:oxygen-independent coproporphyrinogen-3 oxidase
LKREIPQEEYIDHLLNDLERDIAISSDRVINTIFIGGGTPSLLHTSVIARLLDTIHCNVPVSKNAEISIEINPESADFSKMLAYEKIGINRFSIGVQSFNGDKLKLLGRLHSSEEASRAISWATRLNLDSINTDIMHGLPDQSLKQALDDLKKIVFLNVPHLSWYQLTIEPYTLFSSKPPQLPNDNILWNIFERGHEILVKSGYQRYEISSYCKPGHRCQHNINYWRFGDYIGIGCGAHGKLTFPDGRILRTVKSKYPQKFMQGKYLQKQIYIKNIDKPFEYFLNRFRLLEDIPYKEFTLYTGLEKEVVSSCMHQAANAGYIEINPTCWRVTTRGVLFLNSLLEFFIASR